MKKHEYGKWIQQLVPSLVGLILFILSIWAIQQELAKYSPQEILVSLKAISDQRLFTASILMLMNYLMLTGYDTLAMVYIQGSLDYKKTAFVGFMSYAISNSVGLALLSGSAIRYRFYAHWGLSNRQIASIIGFCNLSFWLGLLTVGGITFLIDPLQVPSFLRLPFAYVLKGVSGAWMIPRVLWFVYVSRRTLSRRRTDWGTGDVNTFWI
jgi:uncharacterized membrane protein YbhN (UPF0104 family)